MKKFLEVSGEFGWCITFPRPITLPDAWARSCLPRLPEAGVRIRK